MARQAGLLRRGFSTLRGALGAAQDVGGGLFNLSPGTLGALGTAGQGATLLGGLAGVADAVGGDGPTGQRVLGGLSSGVQAANAASQLGGLGSIPYAGPIASLLNLGSAAMSGPNAMRNVANTIGQTALMGGLTGGASLGLGLGAGLAGSVAALPFAMFAPNGGPFGMLLPDRNPEAEMQRMKRTMDANSLTGELMRGIQTGDLRAPVGGSTVGDALASVLNFNRGGGWAPGGDTSHAWLPDPFLRPMQSQLHGAGFLGTHVDPATNQIVFREPRQGDVGGVGEMVMGGGLKFVNPEIQGRLDDLMLGGFHMTPEQAMAVATDDAVMRGGPMTHLEGSQAWSHLLRSLAGVPQDAPNVFDLQLAGHLQSAGTGQAPQPFNWAVYGDSPQAREQFGAQAQAQDDAAAYASLLDPDVQARVLEAARQQELARLNQQWIAGGGGTG